MEDLKQIQVVVRAGLEVDQDCQSSSPTIWSHCLLREMISQHLSIWAELFIARGSRYKPTLTTIETCRF